MAETKLLPQDYERLLAAELIPAVGCTEPSCIAFVAAKARQVLGGMPERSVVRVSGNLIKNTKSVIVPRLGGMKGIRAAVAAGYVAARPELGLEVLDAVDDPGVAAVREYLELCPMEICQGGGDQALYVEIEAFRGTDCARVVLRGGHLNLVLAERNGKILFSAPTWEEGDDGALYGGLNIEDIVEYSATAPLDRLRPLLKRQVDCNMAIAEEGLANDWGANVGRAMLHAYGNDVKIRAAAWAAAGSDARMSGCHMPVVIISGSGNQGITASVPVAVYARELGEGEDKMYRAVLLSDLVTLCQKAGIGRLSAFCGAVCAGCGATAGIAWLTGGGYREVAHTIVNTLAVVSGIVCDGAKPSCAAKIAVAVETGLLGMNMFTLDKEQFLGGDGIVRRGVDNTIANVGRMASRGMKETDREILRIMTEDC